jgi:hypothetical protein
VSTYFYNRTAFLIFPTRLPECFLELDREFEAGGVTESSRLVDLAENTCRRLGDVKWFALQIQHEIASPNVFEAATKVGTLLVAHLNSRKALLDAGSVTAREWLNGWTEAGSPSVKPHARWAYPKPRPASSSPITAAAPLTQPSSEPECWSVSPPSPLGPAP